MKKWETLKILSPACSPGGFLHFAWIFSCAPSLSKLIHDMIKQYYDQMYISNSLRDVAAEIGGRGKTDDREYLNPQASSQEISEELGFRE